MQIDATQNQNFGFSYTTSSGKNLSLSMFDKQSASYNNDGNSQTLSLRREYGFSFSYQGSKLTQTDIAEIKDAMKDVEPLINNFLKNSKVGELEPRDFITSAMQIANILPSSGDENKQNATVDNLVSKFDDLLKQNQSDDTKQNETMLQDSKKLIDEIRQLLQKQLQTLQDETEKNNKKSENGFDFYA